MMNWGFHYGDGAGLWWLFGLLCFVVLVGAVIWLLVAVTRGSHHVPPQQPWQPPYVGPVGPVGPAGPGRPTPYEILRERLARGEVSVEDYRRTLEALGPDPTMPIQPPPTPGSQPPA